MHQGKFRFSLRISRMAEEVGAFMANLALAKLNVELMKEELDQWDGKEERSRSSYRDSIRELGCGEAENGGWKVIVIHDTAQVILSVGKLMSPGEWQFMDFDDLSRQALAKSVKRTPLQR